MAMPPAQAIQGYACAPVLGWRTDSILTHSGSQSATPVQTLPILIAFLTIYDTRFWIYDNTIMSSILRGFTAYIFIKLEITN